MLARLRRRYVARLEALEERKLMAASPLDATAALSAVPAIIGSPIAGQPVVQPAIVATARHFFADGSGNLFSVNLSNGRSHFLGKMNVVMYDIAFHSDGQLYGVSWHSTLYRINVQTAQTTMIANLRSTVTGRQIGVNALEFRQDGKLYAAGGNTLYEVNPTTGMATPKVTFATDDGTSAGDLAFDPSGNLYVTTNKSKLLKIDPTLQRVQSSVSIGMPDVFGLIYNTDGTLYGLRNNPSRIYRINPTTGQTAEVAPLNNVFNMVNGAFGAALSPTAIASRVTTWMAGSKLRMEGTEGNDTVIYRSNTEFEVNGQIVRWNAANTTRIEVHAMGGNDSVYLYNAAGQGATVSSTLWGDEGDDFLQAGAVHDELNGGPGLDRMFGGMGRNKYTDEFTPGITVKGTVAASDVRQGNGAGTCSLMASLASMAQRGQNPAAAITYHGGNHYSVRLFRPGTGWISQHVTFNGAWYDEPMPVGTNQTVWESDFNHWLYNDPRPAVEGESWVIIIQRAYLQEIRARSTASAFPDRAIDPAVVLTTLTGRATTEKGVVPGVSATTAIRQALAANRNVVVGFNQPRHAYTVLSATATHVKLRDPKGYRNNPNEAGGGVFEITWAQFHSAVVTYYIN